MKKFVLFFGIILLSINIMAQSDSTIIDTTTFNQVVIDTSMGQEILLGYCNIEGLKNFPETGEQFQNEYDEYEPYLGYLKKIKDSLMEFKIIIVMGSWCGDSKREVPRFYKILDEFGYPTKSITLICVDRAKKAGNLNLDDYYVELVPTFIFMKDNVEKGRIIEAPSESLEADMSEIINQ